MKYGRNSFIALLLLLGCSDHPFGNNEIIPRNRQINGNVVLGDGFGSQGVYVWLEGFDIGTFVDETGMFRLTLPVRHLQAAPGGVTGAFLVYFYMANYYLSARLVATKRGEFLYSQGDLGENGKFNSAIKLEKFLSITTKVVPLSIKANSPQSIFITIILQAVSSPVKVVFPAKDGGKTAPIFFKKIDSGEYFVYQTRYKGVVSDGHIQVGEEKYSRKMILDMPENQNLPPGRYVVVPYFFIRHEKIPDKLLESLGFGFEDIEQYLNIPLQIQSDTLTVS